jgi:hypothetical protein
MTENGKKRITVGLDQDTYDGLIADDSLLNEQDRFRQKKDPNYMPTDAELVRRAIERGAREKGKRRFV